MNNQQLYQQLENKAHQFRQKNNFNSTESLPVESLLLQLNVISIFRPISEKLSGMAIKLQDSDATYRFMLVNSEHNVGRQNFTICHELYHLFIQEKFSSQFCSTGNFDKRDIEEYKADVFASYLLMPSFGIQNLIPIQEQQLNTIGLSTIIKIEQYFQCSRLALLYRLRNLGFIDQTRVEYYKVKVKEGAYQHGYDTNLYKKNREGLQIGDYGDLANALFEKEQISEGHYAELMKSIGVNIFDTLIENEEYDG